MLDVREAESLTTNSTSVRMKFGMQYDVATKVVVEHSKEEMLRWFLRLDPEYVELTKIASAFRISIREKQ